MTGRVLITGAASGLGRAMAERFARAGARVLLADIDDARLAATRAELAQSDGTGGAQLQTLHLDVRSDADWEAARDWVRREWGGLDLLVNNAGVAAGGRMELVPMADWDWIIDINLKSVVRGCRTFIPVFKEQRSGYIVNTASLAGLANLPAMASYNTTKAAVIALSQTLRYELAPYKIGVSVLCPAFVKTNLASSMRSPEPGAIEMARQLIDNSTVSAEQVADAVFQAVLGRRFLILTHREGKVLRTAQRISPGLVERVVGLRWRAARRRLEAAESAPSPVAR